MIKDLEYYKRLAGRMVEDDRDRDIAYGAYDDMWHNKWELPDELTMLGWVRKFISTDPHDAVSAGTRVLSSLKPKITMQPLASDQATKELANDRERNLSWQLESANKRRKASITRDATMSALLYHEICAQVIDLDYQIEERTKAGAETRRLTAARRFGRFMVNFYNPKCVHVRYSNVMPEAVLLVQKRTAQDIMDEFGSPAISALQDTDEPDNVWYTLYDFWDYDVHAVWASPVGEPNTKIEMEHEVSSEVTIIAPADHGLEFLPWISRVGGSTLETDPMHQRHPILYSIYTAGQWDNQNIAQSLYLSEVIAHTGSPRFKQEGAAGQTAEIDWTDPARIAKAPPGSTLDQLAPQQIDNAMAELDDRLRAQITKSTVASVLQNADVPAGLAYATLNLQTQTAVGALKPFKELAEQAIADILELMLLWVVKTDKPLYAYGNTESDMGMEYMIEPDTIDPTAIYIQVELTPDVPTDRIQRINAAVLAVDKLHLPIESALEDIGIEDPQSAMRQRFYEMLLLNIIQTRMTEYQSMSQLKIQKMQMDMQMEAQIQMQQAQMQMQQAQAQPQGMPGQGMGPMTGSGQGMPPGPEPSRMGPPGIPNAQGQGFNPAMGGMPPQMMMPSATREGQSGMTRSGDVIEETLIGEEGLSI